MPEAARRAPTQHNEQAPDKLALVSAVPRVPLLHLLRPKWITARIRARGGERGRAARIALLGVTGALFWAFVLVVLFRLLLYFRSVPDIGPFLAGKLLGLVFVSFFAILLLSNIITALSSFFVARDLDLLVAAPVDWLRLYGAKLLETAVHSSWMVVLMAVPIFIAYGVAYDGGILFPLVVLSTFLPFLFIPAVVGSAITLLLVRVFPARRTRDILSVIAVLSAGGLVLLFRIVRPEQLARPEGFRSLVDFIAVLRTPTSPFLPSEWVQRAVMSSLLGVPDVLPYYMLWSTAAAFVVLGALLHRSLYTTGFTKAQESSERWARGTRLKRVANALLAPLGVVRRELLMKETRVFFRDTTQWSQLILLGVLVIVYVFNIKFLPLRGEGITFFLVNVIPFLNLVLAGFVLASIAARFIFPGVSLEGRTLWLLMSSPLRMRELLWAKFWIGTLPLLILALGIVFVTNVLLQVSSFMMYVSLFSITLLTFALAGLALALGTVFPQFDTENAAQIPTSFGGLVYMMSAVALIGAVVVLEARPVYGYVSARAFGGTPDVTEMIIGFGLAAALCIVTLVGSVTIAVRRLGAVER
ncbi:MAG: putative ABC transporter permease subunit [Gemmatimonadaceae bacterium]